MLDVAASSASAVSPPWSSKSIPLLAIAPARRARQAGPMLARVRSGALRGIDALVVDVEVDVSSGLPHTTTVGLPDGAVREGTERIRAALRNCGFKHAERRVTVNLGPAGVRKEGAAFDLPIALGLLAAFGDFDLPDLSRWCVLGELGLDGRVHGVRGALPIAAAAIRAALGALMVPAVNAPEAALALEEAIEVTAIHSVAGLLDGRPLVAARPVRAPHCSISDAALLGGGSPIRPGEVTLAHRGVLFMDELPEFRRNVLEPLRQPLEERRISVARGAGAVLFPAAFQLVAAMNPCPCGYLGDGAGACRCTPPLVDRYRARVSGPLLDRIDLHVEVPRVPVAALADDAPSEEPSAAVRARVEAARARQRRRLLPRTIPLNAHISGREVRRLCRIGPAGRRLLEAASERLGLSARAYTRILRVARTIADLAGEDEITTSHLAEAIQYRSLDRRRLASPYDTA